MSVVSSLPLDLAGEQCPLCLDPLSEFIDLTQRQCKHIVCTACFHAGEKASGYCNNACPVCRVPCVASTRNNASLVTHFPATKQLMAVSKEKRKGDESRGRLPREGPSLGSERAGAGADKRVEDPERPSKKKKVQEKRADKEDGGFTFANRGDVRRLGISVPTGDAHTCLPDATWPLIKHVLPSTKLTLETIRRSISRADSRDPNFSMAKTFVGGYGLDLHYDRRLNNPRALFRQRDGAYLVQLQLFTDVGIDYHYVAYLAATGHVIDNHPRAKVPVVDDIDRSTNKLAIKVFAQLFPGAQRVHMKAVSELSKVGQRSHFIERIVPSIVPPTTRSTPATFDDLFVELYHDKYISLDELNEIVPILD